MHFLGLSITRNPAPHMIEKGLREIIHRQCIDLVIDVGAHHGGFARMLRDRVGYRGRIVSFEPCLASFEALKETMAGDSSWAGYRLALGDRDETATLNLHGNDLLNSLLPINGIVADALLMHGFRGTETVRVARLDSQWPTLKLPGQARVLLKTDTQGNDPCVIRGASGILDRVVAIQSELHTVEDYKGTTLMIDALVEYRAAEFHPFGFYPIGVSSHYGFPAEFDVLFVRCDQIAAPEAKRRHAVRCRPVAR